MENRQKNIHNFVKWTHFPVCISSEKRTRYFQQKSVSFNTNLLNKDYAKTFILIHN